MIERETPPGVTPLAEEVEGVQRRASVQRIALHRDGEMRLYASPTIAKAVLRNGRILIQTGVLRSIACWWEFGPHARFVIAWRTA